MNITGFKTSLVEKARENDWKLQEPNWVEEEEYGVDYAWKFINKKRRLDSTKN